MSQTVLSEKPLSAHLIESAGVRPFDGAASAGGAAGFPVRASGGGTFPALPFGETGAFSEDAPFGALSVTTATGLSVTVFTGFEGGGATSMSDAARVTPMTPTAAAGIGSRISPATTAAKIAK